ncbi:helix-turn-helix transcriptional regulator [Actinoplanes sp. DH11]|uniref:helix-turn-helix domain-containing protein n=1 Tax=Actinoplanes sp. DH11 TaxID=2857011 RepID=UPI001E5DE4D4|nr:helix-turn-helix transcriptional regulator [Actinoplanes sp. DH11]
MQGEPPAVARRRVRLALIGYRQAKGLNQTEVSHLLGWSLSKVQRIEAGDVGVSVTDLRALLQLYGVDDPVEVERLTEDARVSRRQRWYEAPEYRRHLTKSMRQLLQFEAEATEIRVYQPSLVPGVLQTPAVAEAVFDWWTHGLTPRLTAEDRRVRYDVRMLRKRQILDRQNGPDYYLILDESVLLRKVGGAKAMAEQLESLEQTSHLPRIHIRMIPLDKGGESGILGPFQIVSLSESGYQDAVLYQEFYGRDRVVSESTELDFHSQFFERLWSLAADEHLTRIAILAEAYRLRRSLDE